MSELGECVYLVGEVEEGELRLGREEEGEGEEGPHRGREVEVVVGVVLLPHLRDPPGPHGPPDPPDHHHPQAPQWWAS